MSKDSEFELEERLIWWSASRRQQGIESNLLMKKFMSHSNFIIEHSCSIFCGSSLLETIGKRLEQSFVGER